MTRQLAAPPVRPGHEHAGERGAPDAAQASMLELLSWLLRYPLLRASDLATVMGLSASATAARLAQARADGLVRSVPASLLGRHVARLHALTPLGLAAFVERDGVIALERARHCQADLTGLLRLLSDLPAVLATQAFVLALIAHAEEALCLQPAQRITWSWSRHVRLRSLSTDSDEHSGHPALHGDASVRLVVRSAVQGAAVSYWLMVVWDSGLSRTADVRRELQAFLRIRNTYECQGQLLNFPALLVLAPNARRATLWQAQALRLATERWLTHPLRGGALACDDNAPLFPFLAITMDTVDPWQADWRSFAQPGTQMLSDIAQAGSNSSSGQSAPWPVSCRRGHMRGGAELARLILRLDARSLCMLEVLYLHPLLPTHQLSAELGIQPISVERMLRHLRRLDLVQMQTWNGVQQGALSDRCVLLLAHCAHLPGGACVGLSSSHPPHVLRRYQREVRALACTPEHTAGVYGFFTGLLQSCAAERAQGHDAALLWWETGSRCARAFRDAGGWQVVCPDGAGEWRVENQRFRFWLEWDRGTMGLRDLTVKFAAYARYLRSGEWRVDGNESLPYLLIVTSDVGQEIRVMQALQCAMTDVTLLSITITQALLLAERGLLAPVWRPLTSDAGTGRIRIGAPCALFTGTSP